MKYHRNKTKKFYQIVQDEQTIKQKNAKRQISETHLFTRSSLMCSVLGTDHVGPVIGASVSVSLAQMVTDLCCPGVLSPLYLPNFMCFLFYQVPCVLVRSGFPAFLKVCLSGRVKAGQGLLADLAC